jgi:hypothetical protein
MNLRMKLSVAVIALVVIGFSAWRWARARSPAPAAEATRTPLPHRVRVEVLNSGKISGAAREAAVLLRHAGLDVVNYGDAGPSLAGRERNQVLVRRGDTTGAGRVLETLGPADILDLPDPSRLVELTVVLGRDFGAKPRARP